MNCVCQDTYAITVQTVTKPFLHPNPRLSPMIFQRFPPLQTKADLYHTMSKVLHECTPVQNETLRAHSSVRFLQAYNRPFQSDVIDLKVVDGENRRVHVEFYDEQLVVQDHPVLITLSYSNIRVVGVDFIKRRQKGLAFR